MTVANGTRPRSPPVKHHNLKDSALRNRLVTLKLSPQKLGAFASKREEDESMERPEEEESEKEEAPLQDHDTPLIRFRHNSDLAQPKHRLLSTQNTVRYRPRISNPRLFEKYLDRHPDACTHFEGLCFYIDYPASTNELETAVTEWTDLFLRLGREAGWMDHVEVVWGRHWVGGDANPVSFDTGVLEALAMVEVERFVRILGAYERGFVEGVLEDTMTVGSDDWVGFIWA